MMAKRLALSAAIIGLAALSAGAQPFTSTWVGTDANWTDAANWDANVPDANTIGVFDNTGTSLSVDLQAAARQAHQVRFDDAGRGYSVGGGTLRLMELGGTRGRLENTANVGASVVNVVSADVRSATAADIVVSGGTLKLDGADNQLVSGSLATVNAGATLHVTSNSTLDQADIALNSGTLKLEGVFSPGGTPLLLDHFLSADDTSGSLASQGIYNHSGGNERRMRDDSGYHNHEVAIDGFVGSWDTTWNYDGGKGSDVTSNCRIEEVAGGADPVSLGFTSNGLADSEGGMVNYWKDTRNNFNLGRNVDVADSAAEEYWFSMLVETQSEHNNDFGEVFLGFGDTPGFHDKFVAIGYDQSDQLRIRAKDGSTTEVQTGGLWQHFQTHLLVGRVEVDRAGAETVTFYLDPTDVRTKSKLSSSAAHTVTLDTSDFIGADDVLTHFRWQGYVEDAGEGAATLMDELTIATAFTDWRQTDYITGGELAGTLTVGGSSTLDAAAGASLGGLVMNADATLNAPQTAPITAPTTELKGNVAFNADADITLGAVTNSAVGPIAVAKSGAGTLTLNDATTGSAFDGGVFNVSGGTVHVTNADGNTSIGTASVTMSGGVTHFDGGPAGTLEDIRIDFDENSNGPEPSAPWNATVMAGTVREDLIDYVTGLATDVDVDVSDSGWSGSGADSAGSSSTSIDWLSTDARTDYIWSETGDLPEVVLGGLDPTATYKIELVSAHGSENNGTQWSVAEQPGSDVFWNAGNALSNDEQIVWDNLEPNAAGELHVMMGPGGGNGHLNAMRLTKIGFEYAEYGTDFTLTDDAGIDVSGAAGFGTLTLENGAVLTVTGDPAYARFESTTLDPNGAASSGLNVGGDSIVWAGPYDAGLSPVTFLKQGAGTLVMNGAPADDANTTVEVQGGSLVIVQNNDSNTPMPDSLFTLAGGRLIVASGDGNDITFDNDISMTASGAIEASKGVGGVGGAIEVAVDDAVTIPTGETLTLTAGGAYTLRMMQDLDGNGGLTKDGTGEAVLDANVAYMGATRVLGGSLTIQDDLDNETSNIELDGGHLTVNGFAHTGDVSVTDANLVVTSPASAVVLSAANLAVGPAGGIDVDGNAIVQTADLSGIASFGANLTTTGNSFTIRSGETDVTEDLATTDLNVLGGILTVGGDVDAPDGSVINGGRLNVSGVFTSPSLALTAGGILSAQGPNSLSGLPDFTVESNGGVGWLNLGTAQVAAEMPQVTVQSGSLLDGNTAGLLMIGKDPLNPHGDEGIANVLLEDGAVFGGSVAPNEVELGDVRLRAAIIGGDFGIGRVIKVGTDSDPNVIDDVFTGATYGPWSRADFQDPATIRDFQGTILDVSGNGIEIAMNGEGVRFTADANYSTPNTDVGVLYSGAGELELNGGPGGTWTVVTREGPGTAETLRGETVIADFNNSAAIPAGKELRVLGGRLNVDAGLEADARLTLGEGGMMWMHGDQFSQGNIHVQAGGYVYTDDTNEFADANWTWESGAILAFRVENFDPYTAGWPMNVTLVPDHPARDSFEGSGFILQDGAVIQTSDDQNVSISSSGPSVTVDQTSGPDATIGLRAMPGQTLQVWDTLDLQVDPNGTPDDGDEYILDLVVGATGEVSTVRGNTYNDYRRQLVRNVPTGRVELTPSDGTNETLRIDQVELLSGTLELDKRATLADPTIHVTMTDGTVGSTLRIEAGHDSDANDYWNGGSIAVGGGNTIQLRIDRGEAPDGHGFYNRLGTPITVVADGNAASVDAVFQPHRMNNSSPWWDGFAHMADVTLTDGSLVTLSQGGSDHPRIMLDLTLDGESTVVPQERDSFFTLGHIGGSGTLNVDAGDDRIRMIGSMAPGVTVVASGTDPVELTDHSDGDLSLHGKDIGYGEGFRFNGGTLHLTENTSLNHEIHWEPNGTLIHQGRTGDNNGPDLYAGRAGGEWGHDFTIALGKPGSSATDLASNKANVAEFRVDDVDAGQDRPESTFMGTLRVLEDGYGWIRTRRAGDDKQDEGYLFVPNVVLEPNSVLFLAEADNVGIRVSGTLEGDAKIFHDGAGDQSENVLLDFTGDHTLTIFGTTTSGWSNNTPVEGTIDTAGLSIEMVPAGGNNRRVYFRDGSAVLSEVFTVDSNTGNGVTFEPGSTLDVDETNFLGGVASFYAGQAADLGATTFGFNPDFGGATVTMTTAVFHADVDLAGVDATMSGQGTVNARTTIGGAATLAPSWVVNAGGELVVSGDPGALAGATGVTLAGGRLTANVNGDADVAVTTPILVAETSAMAVDRADVAGGFDRTLAFGPLTIGEPGGAATVLSVNTGNQYDMTFASTTVDVPTGTTAGFELLDTGSDADLGDVTFTDNQTLNIEAAPGSTVSLGDLTGGSAARVYFNPVTLDGGALHLSNATGWAGEVNVTHGRLLVDANLSGYDGGVYVDEVLEITATEPVALHDFTANALRISASLAGSVGPAGFGWTAGGFDDLGEVVIDTPTVADSFRQSDGSGGTQPLTLEASILRSDWAGANFQAPIDVHDAFGLVTAFQADLDFEVSGSIGGPGGLLKTGDAALTLSGGNTYAGDTTVEAGTLVMADANAFGEALNTVELNDGTTLVVDAAGADFDTRYTLVMNDTSTLIVNAAGVNLGGVTVGDNTLTIASDMAGGSAPADAPGTTILDTPTLSGDYVLVLDNTIEVRRDVTVAEATDGTTGSVTFRDADHTMQIDSNVTLAGPRDWEVADGMTVQFNGNILGGQDLTKVGAGTLVLNGAGNEIELLTVGTSPGGIVSIGSGSGAPNGVVVNQSSLYTVDEPDWAFGEVDIALSAGVLGLSRDSDANYDFSTAPTLSLGAHADSTYTGEVTPGIDGFVFGGGAGTLTLDTPLAAGEDLRLGWDENGDSNQEPLPEGNIVLTAETAIDGDVEVYTSIRYASGDTDGPFNAVDPCSGNWVTIHEGGALDLNLTWDGLTNVKMNGGGISNVGDALIASDLAGIFPDGQDYVLGSNFTDWNGNTDIEANALVNAGSDLVKVGVNQVTLRGTQTYGGGLTDVRAGTLTVEKVAGLGSTTQVRVADAASIELLEGGSLEKVTLGGSLSTGGDLTVQAASGDSLVLDGPAPAIDVAGGMTMTVGKVNGAGLGAVLTKTGAGELDIRDGNNVLASSTVKVSDGTVRILGSSGGTSLDTAGVILDGGTLAVEPESDINPGVVGDYWLTGGGQSTTNWDYSQTPDNTQIEDRIDFRNAGTWGLARTDRIAGRWTGFVFFASDTNVEFGVNSDDGSRLWVDGSQVTAWEGGHGMTSADNMRNKNDQQWSDSLFLSAGYHSFEMRQKEDGGGEGAELWWSVEGATAEIIPASALFYGGIANHVAVDSNVVLTESSTILSNAGISADFDTLTMPGGKALEIVGGVSFERIVMDGSLGTVTFDANGAGSTLHTNAITDGGGATTVSKIGSGVLVISPEADLDNTDIDVAEGTLQLASVSGSPLVLPGTIGGVGDLQAVGDGVSQIEGLDLTGTVTKDEAGALVITDALDTPAEVILNAGAVETMDVIDLAGPITVNDGLFTANEDANVAGLTVNDGGFEADKDLTAGTITIETPASLDVAGTTDADAATLRGTVGLVGTATIEDAAVLGGTTTVTQLDANNLTVTGGKLVVETALTAGGSVDLSAGGVLVANNSGALAGMPAFTVADGTNGAWLDLAVAQASVPQITVADGAGLTGATDGLAIRGASVADANTDVVLQQGAVFQGSLAPNTVEMGTTRVQLALFGGGLDEPVQGVGDDPDANVTSDIYTGAAWGVWSRTVHDNPGTVRNFEGTLVDLAGTGLVLNPNNETVPLNADANFVTDTVRFIGTGNVHLGAVVSGPWTDMVRDGTDASVGESVMETWNQVVGAGQTLTLLNGEMVPYSQNVLHGDANMIVGPGGVLRLHNGESRPNAGKVTVQEGGMIYFNNNNRMTNGAEFVFEPNSTLVWSYDNANPNTWPVQGQKNIIIVQDNGNEDTLTNPLRLADGSYLIGRNNWCRLREGAGVAAATDAAPGDTAAIAAPSGNTYAFFDPVNLHVAGDPNDPNDDFHMNLIIGAEGEMTTVAGGNNPLPVTKEMAGTVRIEDTLDANDIHIVSGELRFRNTHAVNVYGDIVVGADTNGLEMERATGLDDDPNARAIRGKIILQANADMWLNDRYSHEGTTWENPYTEMMSSTDPNDWLAEEIVLSGGRMNFEYLEGFEPLPWDADANARTIRQPIRVTANDPCSNYNHHIEVEAHGDPEGMSGGTATVYLTDLTLEEGAVLSIYSNIAENNTETTRTYADLTLVGDAATSARTGGTASDGEDFDVYNVRSGDGADHVWSIGEAGEKAITHELIGSLGDASGGISPNVVHGTLRFRDPCQVAYAPQFRFGGGTLEFLHDNAVAFSQPVIVTGAGSALSLDRDADPNAAGLTHSFSELRFEGGGSGGLTLQSGNGYQASFGSTTVAADTVGKIATTDLGSSLPLGPVDVASGGSLEVSAAGTATVTTLTGAADSNMVISGPGRTVVTGDTSGWSGETTIAAGTLELAPTSGSTVLGGTMKNEGKLQVTGGDVDMTGVTIEGKLLDAPPTAGLEYYFSFDDSATPDTAEDGSGNGRDATISGATYVPGYSGAALEFGGDGDVVERTDAPTVLDGKAGFTFAAWVKSDVINTDKGIMNMINPNGQDRFGIRYDTAGANAGGDDVIKAGIETTGGDRAVETSEMIQTTEWQHVLMTWESGSALTVYIDGVENELTASASTLDGLLDTAYMNTLLIGKGSKFGDGSGGGWDGLIDEVRVYSRRLSEAEISSLISAGGGLGDIDVAAGTSLTAAGFTDCGTVSLSGDMILGDVASSCGNLEFLDADASLTIGDTRVRVGNGVLADIWSEIADGAADGNGILTTADLGDDLVLGAQDDGEGVIFGVTHRADLNLDGVVDGLDLAYIDYEGDAAWYDGDITLDGTVDYLDYITYKRSIGTTHNPAVPEPGTLALLAAAGLVGVLRRRKK